MVRPRHEPFEITAEKQKERWRERFSRRELLQLFGASGAAAIAGCGGGGQETPTPTATEAPAQATPTPTEEEEETPTPTETETETPRQAQTPTGEVTVTDEFFFDVTQTSFKKIEPNSWNQETGFTLNYYQFPLSFVPEGRSASTPEEALDIIVLQAAKKYELDPKNNVFTVTVRDDLKFADGSDFNAEHLQRHIKIIKAQNELAAGEAAGGGGGGETVLPVSMDTLDQYTLKTQLLPGNALLRMLTLIFQGRFIHAWRTHPKFHKKYYQRIFDATTLSAIRKPMQEMFKAEFPDDRIDEMPLGPWMVSEQVPDQLTFRSRTDFPWGLDYTPDLDRIFKGVKLQSIGEQTQEVNAAIAGKKSYIELPNRDTFKRFPDHWELHGPLTLLMGSVMYFSPKSAWGKKTKKARKMRQAAAFLFDAEEFTAVNNLVPFYELTAGAKLKGELDRWVGLEDFYSNWTNYGTKDRGYLKKDAGYQALREGGFEQNKNGMWVDSGTGEILSADITTGSGGLTRPGVSNIVEQFNRNGIEMSAHREQGEKLQNSAQQFTFDWMPMTVNYFTTPHPFFGFREDMGIGSAEGLPVQIATWDWRNGYRRVDVPMPVGNPNGPLTTIDWDKLVTEMTQIESQEKMKVRTKTLMWVLNQWVPAFGLRVATLYEALNTDQVFMPDDAPLDPMYRSFAERTMFAAGWWQPPK